MAEEIRFPRKGQDYVPLPRGHAGDHVQGHAVQTIDASPEQVYAVFSRQELIPSWQDGVVSVTPTGENTARWIMQDPGTGKQVEFDSEISEAVPATRHVSRVLNGSFAGTTDTVTFAAHPAGRGTVVTWVSEFHVPGGIIANAIAAIASRTPEQMLIENLRHLKQLIEAKEIPSFEGQPAGPRGMVGAWKEWLLGETLPIPPGTSDRAKPRDMPAGSGETLSALQFGGIVLVAGAAAWLGMRWLLEA